MGFDASLLYRCSEGLGDAERRLVDTLMGLEPAVIEAGRVALELQGKVGVEMKAQSGNFRTDVVTEADRRVQERILASFAPTPLTGCRLLAEESPDRDDLRARFSPDARLYLTIDPIDGTSRYARNEPYFSTIIGLHDDERPLYTFMHYPAFGWWVRIVERTLAMVGEPPVDLGHLHLDRTVVYTSGNPAEDIADLSRQLVEMGTAIRFGESIGPWGSKFLYLSGHAGGYYAGSPNLYDGLFALHCALARGNVILAQGGRAGERLDLSQMESGPYGLYHPGWYLVVPRAILQAPEP